MDLDRIIYFSKLAIVVFITYWSICRVKARSWTWFQRWIWRRKSAWIGGWFICWLKRWIRRRLSSWFKSWIRTWCNCWSHCWYWRWFIAWLHCWSQSRICCRHQGWSKGGIRRRYFSWTPSRCCCRDACWFA